MTFCPRCGEVFDEPVPADATTDELEGTFALPSAPPPPVVPPPAISPPALPAPPSLPAPSGRRRLPRLAVGLAASLVLIGTGWWLGQHHTAAPAPPPETSVAPASTPTDSLPTDLSAHPTYAAEMATFVSQLRGTGVGAQWPAFGSNDVLVITPPAVVDGIRAQWDQSTYQRLAQGVYGNFAQNRFHAGFSDTDSTTCFVIVSDPSGKVVAADLMGDVE